LALFLLSVLSGAVLEVTKLPSFRIVLAATVLSHEEFWWQWPGSSSSSSSRDSTALNFNSLAQGKKQQ